MKSPGRVVRIQDIQAKKRQGVQIVMLTAYSAWMARLLAESASVDLLLVGDSLGMVELGYDSTLAVTMDDMVRYTRAVRNGAPEAFVVADLPFLACHLGEADAVRNAGRLLQEGGASAVKVEGGAPLAPVVRRMVAAGIPVMGHLGLLPQSVHLLGGFRQQAREDAEQDRLLSDAKVLEDAGVFSLVIECVPEDLATRVTKACRTPVIGIGAGAGCDGQVLVTHDILGLTGEAAPPFARRFASLDAAIKLAVNAFADTVKKGKSLHADAEGA